MSLKRIAAAIFTLGAILGAGAAAAAPAAAPVAMHLHGHHTGRVLADSGGTGMYHHS